MSDERISHPSNSDLTHQLVLARTGFASLAEMSSQVMFATKKHLNPLSKPSFRPGIPAKLTRFDNAEINGKLVPCIILEYLNGTNGETYEYAHPLNTMFSKLEFIPTEECTMTYIRRSRLERGL